MADAAIDNLGRKIDTANMGIGELKGLIASLMKSKVGPVKPIGNTTKDDPAKKLTSLFEKYTKDFEVEAKEQKKLLEKIVDGIKELKSKKSGDKSSKEKPNFSDKVSKSLKSGLKSNKDEQTTAKSVKSLEQIFGKKGSGYTHDIYCEKYLKEIYNVLVEMAKLKGITPAAPEKIEKDLKEKSKEVKKDSSSYYSGRDSLDDYEEELSSKNSWANVEFNIDNFSEAVRWLWSGEDSLKRQKGIARGWLSEIEAIEGVSREEAKNLKRQAELTEKANQIFEEGLRKVGETADKLQQVFLGFNAFQMTFKGIVDEERKFTQEIRQAAYETAGVTKESQSLQRSFEAIGKTASITGFDRSEYQKQYLNALRSGIKDQKRAMILTKTQLNTEKQIGLEAGALGDIFIKYNNELKLTNDQTADIGRGIREVARNTGLVGKEMAEVVSGSQKFVDQMRKAGTATSSSIKNVIGLQAEFKKLGLTDSADRLLTALSSTTGFYEAGIETQSLLANAASSVGLTMDMTTGGIIKSNEKLKLFNKGLMQTAHNFGLGGSNVEEMRANFENLSDEAKRSINLRFKAAFGMEAGEVLGTIEAFENKTKTLGEKLADLNKEKAKNLTLEERAAVAEKERSLKLSAGLGALTALSEAAKNVTSMDQALSKFGARRSEFEGDIKALGGAWTSETAAARTAIESSVNALNEGLKKAGKKGLSIDSARIEKALKDPAALRELTSEITKGEQELATAQKAQADPLTSMDQTLKEINDGIRNMSQGIISGIFNSPLGRVLLGITAIFGFLITGLATVRSGITQMIGFIYNLQKFLSSAFAGGGGFGKVKDKLAEIFTNKEKPEDKVEQEIAKRTEQATQNLSNSNNLILEVLREIRDCICGKSIVTTNNSARPEKTPVSVAEKKAAGQAAKEKMIAEGLDPAVEKSKRRMLEKQEKREKKEEKLLKQKQDNTKKESNIVKKEVKVPSMGEAAESGFDINQIISSGKDMAKSAAAIALLGVGAVALGAAVVFFSKRILSAFNLDMNTILETAGAVAALAAAAGAIAAAGYGAYKFLTENKEAQEAPNIAEQLNTDILKKVAFMVLLGPALVLLGAAIVKVAQLITQAFGLDMGTVAEVAGSVVAIVGAAGALCVGAAEALEGMDNLRSNKTFKALLRNPAKALYTIGKAALALVVLGPGLVLLGSIIVKFSQLIMGALGLDAGTAAKVAYDVAAIIGATSLIALGVVGAMAGLWALGMLANVAWGVAPIIAMGAGALLLLTPAIILLAAGLNLMIRGILAITGIDAGVAAKAAFDVGTLILSSAVIAGSILAGLAGLTALAVLWPFVPLIYTIMGLGAQALIELAIPVMLLAVALNLFTRAVLGITGIDAKSAAQAAFNVAGLIAASGVIALSVLAGVAGLVGLGLLVPLIPIYAPAMVLGAIALGVLTPAIVLLSNAIIGMTKLLTFGTDEGSIQKTIDNLSAVLWGAASIAGSVLLSFASLTALGVLGVFAVASIPLLLLGTGALIALTPVVVGLSNAIMGMASYVLGSSIDPSEAKKLGEDLSSILKSAGDIAWSILGAVPTLAILGTTAILIFASIPFLYLGIAALSALTGPVASFVGTIKKFYESISFVDPNDAVKMGEESAAIFKSVGSVTNHILSARDGMLSLIGANNWGWFGSASDGMNQGAKALYALMPPVLGFISKVKLFYNLVSGIVSPEKAAEMGNGIADILCGIQRVTNGILGVRNGMIQLVGASDWGWFGSITTPMAEGKKALETLMLPVKEFIGSVVAFYKEIASIIDPEAAARMGEGVASILNAVGRVVHGILWVKQGMISLNSADDWGWFSGDPIDQMYEGAKALDKLKAPVKEFIASTVSFYNDVTSIMSPEKACEAGNGVGLILGAVGFVTGKIVQAQEALVALSKSGGWRGIDGVVDQMNAGSEALRKIMWPVIDYALVIQTFSNILNSVFGSKEQVVESANGVANILRAIGFITYNIIASAEDLASVDSKKLSSALSNSFKLINEGMIAPVRKGLGSTAELEEAIKQLDLVILLAEKMNKVNEICKGLGTVELGGPIEAKLGINAGVNAGVGGTTSDKAISQRNEAKEANSAQDSSRLLYEFIETSIRGKGIIVRPVSDDGSKPSVSAIMPSAETTSAGSVQTRVQREKAASSPSKSEVMSPELGEIASSTEQQNAILSEMKALLEKFVELAKPQPTVSTGDGVDPGVPAINSVVGKPTNYYRRVIGNVNNTPSKAIVNVGAKAVS